MFDKGQAESAFKAIENEVGHKFRVLDVRIHPTDLSVTIPSTDSAGQAEVWEVSHKGVLWALGIETAARTRTERADIISGTLEDNLIDIDSDGMSVVPKLVTDALTRARMQTPSRITEMELRRLPKIVEPGVRDPSWLVHVEGIGEEAEISAKPTGEITFADLSRTLRAQNLNLLAGGPDLDEMIEDISREVKDKWTFHYIEIDKSGIDFDVTLDSLGDRARMTRFHANLNGIKTDNLSMPHSGYMNMPADLPFSFKDIDWTMLTKVEQAAKERLGIADGVVQRVELTKPERVGGGGGIEWEVAVKSAKAPLIWNPSQPPVEEGSVAFDMTGHVMRTKYPPGRGPKVDLFSTADLQKAVDTIKQRLGPHVQATELLINADSIDITAQDPKNPKNFAIFTYKNEDVVRADDTRVQILKSLGAGPSWLWELDLLQPAVLQPLAAMEQQAMAHWHIANGHVTRITISKDKMFHAGNDRPLIEIRVAADDNNDQWLYFDFAGNVADPDRPPGAGTASAGRSPAEHGAPSAADTTRDHQDCTGSDPDRVIAGCTRMIQNPNEGPHNRAVAFYNRAGIYKERKDYDRAISDYGEAIKLDPQYVNAFLNRGTAYDAKGDSDASAADFGRVIELKPDDPVAYYDRGYIRCWKKHDYDGAIADLSKAIDLGLRDAPTYLYRALAYHNKKDYRRAIADYDEGLKLSPNYAIALSYRGLSYQGLSDFDHALADYNAAIKADPRLALAYANRGYLRRSQGDIDAAIADYDAALKLDPSANYVYVNRGSAYRAKGDFERAVADYGVAIKANPKYAAAIFNRGFAYFLAGALPKALADLSQANALDPTDAYTVLTLDIVGQKSKLQGQMAQLSGKLDMTAWPAPVIRLFLGKSTPDAVMAATDDPDPTTRRGHICEANYYAGEVALLHGDRDGAIKLFTAASADCPSRWTEWEAADAELKALGVAPPRGTR
ncbi:MAG: tetratricopeptide repeat protein [Alphaproteobacteria bacterium]|nr:tetratricopeptide repeat protein [Alphaproteobacteria bacterium]